MALRRINRIEVADGHSNSHVRPKSCANLPGIIGSFGADQRVRPRDEIIFESEGLHDISLVSSTRIHCRGILAILPQVLEVIQALVLGDAVRHQLLHELGIDLVLQDLAVVVTVAPPGVVEDVFVSFLQFLLQLHPPHHPRLLQRPLLKPLLLLA